MSKVRNLFTMKIIFFTLFMTPVLTFSQNNVIEEVIKSDGKVISRTIENDKYSNKKYSPEKIINLFYDNQNDVKTLTPIARTRWRGFIASVRLKPQV